MQSNPDLLKTLRDEAVGELWRRGDVWLLWEVLLDRDQFADLKKIFEGVDVQAGNLPSDDFVLDISRQRGKSWLCCAIAAVLCRCIPKLFVKYVAQEQKSVRAIVAPTLEALLTNCPDDLKPTFNQMDNVWLWPNGSNMRAAGADGQQYKALRGQRSHLNIKDEAGFYDDYDAVERVLAPQTQTTKGFAIDASTPPESPGHPYTKVAMAARARGRYSHRTIYNHPRMTPAQVDAFLAKEATKKGQSLEEFKASSYFKREYLCEHVIEEDRAIIPEWMKVDATNVLEVPRPQLFDAYASHDVGFRDGMGVLWGFWDFYWARLVIEDELLLFGARTGQVADAVKEKEATLYPSTGPRPNLESRKRADGKAWEPYLRVMDTGGLGELIRNEYAAEHGLSFMPTAKDELEMQVNRLREMTGNGKLFIHPRCKLLRQQLLTGLWNKNRTDFARGENGHADLIACLIYLARNVRRERNPFPPGFGVDHTSQYVTSSVWRTPTEAAVSKLMGGRRR